MSELWKKYELIIAAACVGLMIIVIVCSSFFPLHVSVSHPTTPEIQPTPTSGMESCYSGTHSLKSPEDAIRDGERAKELLDKMSQYGTES